MVRTLVLGTALAVGLATGAFAASSQQQLVDEAALTVEHLQSSQDPGAAKAREYIRQARAVLIVPQLVKGGFFVGAQGGNGVLVSRDGAAGWGEPGFYTMGAASFGLQIGVEVSEIVLIIMDDKALRAVTRNQFKVGAEAGLAIATLGAGAEANTTSNAGADIYGFAISKGLFGGIAVEGGVIHPRNSWTSAYYGGRHTSASVVRKDSVANPGADAMRQKLGAL